MELIGSPINRKARKKHLCDWCLCNINIGEIYGIQTINYDGLYKWKYHIKCLDIAIKLKMFDDCYDGLSSEYFIDYIINEFYEIHRHLNSDIYKSKDYKFISFEEKLDFVCNYYLKKAS